MPESVQVNDFNNHFLINTSPSLPLFDSSAQDYLPSRTLSPFHQPSVILRTSHLSTWRKTSSLLKSGFSGNFLTYDLGCSVSKASNAYVTLRAVLQLPSARKLFPPSICHFPFRTFLRKNTSDAIFSPTQPSIPFPPPFYTELLANVSLHHFHLLLSTLSS